LPSHSATLILKTASSAYGCIIRRLRRAVEKIARRGLFPCVEMFEKKLQNLRAML
jgi:hypothetical protein